MDIGVAKTVQGSGGGRRVKAVELKEETWLEPGALEVFEERKAFSKSIYLKPEHPADIPRIIN